MLVGVMGWLGGCFGGWCVGGVECWLGCFVVWVALLAGLNVGWVELQTR